MPTNLEFGEPRGFLNSCKYKLFKYKPLTFEKSQALHLYFRAETLKVRKS